MNEKNRCLENSSYKTELRVVTSHIELVTRKSYIFSKLLTRFYYKHETQGSKRLNKEFDHVTHYVDLISQISHPKEVFHEFCLNFVLLEFVHTDLMWRKIAPKFVIFHIRYHRGVNKMSREDIKSLSFEATGRKECKPGFP